jgi:uncharacterized protein (DUF488 family)
VGHGARSAVAFVSLLQESRITTLVDVRSYPVSRRHPQFSRDALVTALAAVGIEYRWQGEALGGLRKGGYASHMETPLFTDAATGLVTQASQTRLCIMCAETDPADCHRSHIADWLVAHGERVVHVLAPGQTREHGARLF